ncbi:hypothetical protein H0176_22155 [Methylorubrum populi]|uniref:hypothetical protein n=1 Tax=Methylorubrum rhodesianum TaxID=29427 RepID=UPI00190D4F11|nr:hypothetical protein [Methylorubrum rhodesianum]MBK3404164.1 hypothetical protein [Methylorubrum rhodesianum]MBY0142954.1 hypothetical protein [Methylorubrum populi]
MDLRSAMKPQVQDALFEWLAGLVIGVTPLLAHAILHGFVDPTQKWEDSWSGDILFVCITTSGLSAVTVFTRLAKGTLKNLSLNSTSYLMMSLTLLLFLFAGMLYGIVASGHARDFTIWAAIFFLFCSATVSLYFEMTLASALAAVPAAAVGP